MTQKIRLRSTSLCLFLILFLLQSFSTLIVAQTTFVQGQHEAFENVIKVKIDRLAADGISPQRLQSDAVSGIPSLDAVNDEMGAVSMERVFITDPRFAERHREAGLDQWYRIWFNDQSDVDHLINRYRAVADVEIAEPIYLREHVKKGLDAKTKAAFEEIQLNSESGFDDPELDAQWHYFNDGQTDGTAGSDINLFPAWALENGSSDVIVKVVDSGVDVNHPDIENMMWVNPTPGPENGFDGDIHGWNFASNNDNIIDIDGHGTHVSGTIAAESNNGLGVSGVAGGDGSGNGARIMVARTFDDHTDVIGGFPATYVYGADNGAVISQNSWGGGGFSQALVDAIQYFVDFAGYDENGNVSGPIAGGVIIFSSGNDNNDILGQPIASNIDNLISVSATTHNDTKAWYSTYGDWVNVSAPGGETTDPNFVPVADGVQGILSTVTNGNYGFSQGTSMAAPHVSGIAALIASRFPGIDRDEVTDRIILTTRDFENDLGEFDGLMGRGVVDAFAAIQEADEPPAPITDLAVDGEPGQVSIDLTWTATGTSGTEGQAQEYDLRFSESPINEGNFEDATQIEGLPSPQPAGSVENFTVTGLETSTTYYFAIKASHFLSGTSDISNILEVTTEEGEPILEVEPLAVEFGEVAIGFPDTATVSLANIGTEVMVISELNLDGDASYQILSDFNPPEEVEPGSSYDVDILFDPDQPGEQTSTLLISSDGSEEDVEVSIVGSAIHPPVAVFSDEEISTEITGTGTAEVVFEIANTGLGDLEYSIDISGADYLAAEPSAGTIEPDESDFITFIFDADGLVGGEYSADVIITTNDPANESYTLSTLFDLIGIANLVVASTEIDFGNVEIGTNQPTAIRLSNEGNGVLNIGELQFDNDEFFSNTSTLTIDPNENEVLVVRFSPDEIGERIGTLTLVSNDPDSPTEFTLTGTGTVAPTPPVAVISETVYEPTVTTGETEEFTVSLENQGEETLEASITISEVIPVNGENPDAQENEGIELQDEHNGVSWLSADIDNIEIDPDSTGSITLTADASGLFADVYSAELILNTNDPDNEEISVIVNLNVQAADPAFIQVIHNSPENSIADIGIRVNGEIAVESLTYQDATAFLEVPSRVENEIELFINNENEDLLIPVVFTFTEDESYLLIAAGVFGDESLHNPDGEDIEFQVFVVENVPQTSEEGTVALALSHGVTDAPTFDVQLTGTEYLFEDLTYGTTSSYQQIDAAEYEFDLVFPQEHLARTYNVDFTAYEGLSAVGLFSGFFQPEEIEYDGEMELLIVYSDGTVAESEITTSLEETELPDEFSISQNYPNPFNPTTQIEFALPRAENVRLEVFDVLGRRVAILINDQVSAGHHSFTFDASQLSSGVYLYRIQAGEFVESHQMMLIK